LRSFTTPGQQGDGYERATELTYSFGISSKVTRTPSGLEGKERSEKGRYETWDVGIEEQRGRR
jgi:hypothetical protein